MTIGAIITLVVTLLVICGAVAAALAEHRRRERKQDMAALSPLSMDDARYYASTWEHVQGGFVDGPAVALLDADRLIRRLLHDLGCVGNDRSELPRLPLVADRATVTRYREAAAVARRATTDAGAVSVEEMREALVGFHRYFDALLRAGSVPVPMADR
jgi:hypothetical protein